MSESAASYLFSEPENPLVCCHCKGPIVTHLFHRENHWLRSYHCPLCGDVMPVRAGPPATPLARRETALEREAEWRQTIRQTFARMCPEAGHASV